MPVYRQNKRKLAYVPNYMKAKKKYKKTTPRIPRLPSSIARGEFGFPPTLSTTLRYVENLAFTSALGAVQSNVFRFNSLFDPNETGVGHQPMYYDQFSAVYNRYIVNKCKAKVTFNVVTETAATSCFVVGLIGQATGTIDTIPQTNMEDNHSKYKIMNGRNGSTGQAVLYLEYSPQRDLNLSKQDDSAGAVINTNPSATYKLIPWVADLQAIGNTNVVATVEMIFDCTFSDPLFTPGS